MHAWPSPRAGALVGVAGSLVGVAGGGSAGAGGSLGGMLWDGGGDAAEHAASITAISSSLMRMRPSYTPRDG